MIAPGKEVLAIVRAEAPDSVRQVTRSSDDWRIDAAA